MHAKLAIIQSPGCCSTHTNPTLPLPLALGPAVISNAELFEARNPALKQRPNVKELNWLNAPDLGEPESITAASRGGGR